MLSKLFSKLLLLIWVLNVSLAQAAVTSRVIENFSEVDARIGSLLSGMSSKQLLVVLDIDNTLLTSTSDLGGDIWYQWQRGKLDIKPTEAQIVPCLFEDAIGLLYELAPMRLTEEQLPGLISRWQDAGITTFALTSRSPAYRAATERELLNKGINFAISPVKAADHSDMVIREVLQRPLSYSQGIMMTTGMHKGQMLRWLLEQAGQAYQHIVFVDDGAHNIEALKESFQDEASVQLDLYHYRRVEATRIRDQGKVLTRQQADRMASDWNKLIETLETVFPARKPSDVCLTSQP